MVTKPNGVWFRESRHYGKETASGTGPCEFCAVHRAATPDGRSRRIGNRYRQGFGKHRGVDGNRSYPPHGGGVGRGAFGTDSAVDAEQHGGGKGWGCGGRAAAPGGRSRESFKETGLRRGAIRPQGLWCSAATTPTSSVETPCYSASTAES